MMITHCVCFSPITEYRWSTSEWTECTRTCGGGSRNRTVTCLNVSIPITSDHTAELTTITETEVNGIMCDMSEKAGEMPTSRELCNTEDCPIWLATEYSEASHYVRAGNIGTKIVVDC